MTCSRAFPLPTDIDTPPGGADKMRWPFQAKAPTHASFPVDTYRLDASIDGLAGLVEFSPLEYATMGRQFEGETGYNAPPVTFLGQQWNLMLGTVHSKIYKIAPHLEVKTQTRSKSDCDGDASTLHGATRQTVFAADWTIHLGHNRRKRRFPDGRMRRWVCYQYYSLHRGKRPRSSVQVTR